MRDSISHMRVRRTVVTPTETPLARALRQFFQNNPQYNRIICLWDLDGTLYDERKFAGIPGAPEIVTTLANHGIRHALYSMGDQWSRESRFKTAKLPRDAFFELYCIPMGRKDPETWRQLIADFQKNGAFVIYVGDSWVHDVAVGLGRAEAVIWVQGDRQPGIMGTPADVENYPIWTVKTVAAIPALLPELLANPYRGADKAAYTKYFETARTAYDKDRSSHFDNWQDDKKHIRGKKKGVGKDKGNDRRTGRQLADLSEGYQMSLFGQPDDDFEEPWDDDYSWPGSQRSSSRKDRTLDGPWPRTQSDKKDKVWADDTDDTARLLAWNRGEICGCGEDLDMKSEKADGCCVTCKATGERTQRPLPRRAAS